MPMHDKQFFEAKYKKIVSKLDSCKIEISEIDSKEDTLKKVIQTYKNAIEEQKKIVYKELDQAINMVEWDKFVIAFFGETNAGKSTTIETFRIKLNEETRAEKQKNSLSGVDGEIVGDGQSDFTKDYNEYEMSINGNPIVLIDVPGIEGNESVFKEGIQKALSKAHCVFYVYAGNGQINEETTKKIKDYLGDWVSVYSILNIRGGVSNYDEEEEREKLKGVNEEKNERLVEKTFKNVLGDVYRGNISIQALLAMCSVANFSEKREDLIKQQESFLKFFGNRESLYEFSAFPEIMTVVEQKSKVYKEEIIAANRQKLQSVAHASISKLLEVSESQKQDLTNLENHLKKFRLSASREFSKAGRNIESGCLKSYDSMFESIKSKIYECIDQGLDESELNSQAQKIATDSQLKFISDCEMVCNEQLKILADNLSKRRAELANYYASLASTNGLNFDYSTINLNFSEAFGNIGDFHFDDFIEIASIIATLFISVPMAIISSVGYIIRKLMGDGGKGKTKNAIQQKLYSTKTKERATLLQKTENLKKKLDNESRKIKLSVKKEETNVAKLREAIENSSIEINQIVNELNF